MAEAGGVAVRPAAEASEDVESSMARLAVADSADGKAASGGGADVDELDDAEQTEVVLFHLKECYVYKIPPRKTAASHRADEWNINAWAWQGAISVTSRGDQCAIRLLDATSGDLFALAPVRPQQPLPLEAVIDSSRFFVLRIEDSSPAGPTPSSSSSSPPSTKPNPTAAPVRHAFIGLGFRERTQAYDFQAAVYDHVKYVNKRREAQEMGQQFDSKPPADYRLKEGQKLHLDIKTPTLRAKSSIANLPLSPTTPGKVAFKTPSLKSASLTAADAPDAPSPMRQASGDHADAAPSPPHAPASTSAAASCSSPEFNPIATPPILPPPPPARLSSPSTTPSIAWAFQSDSPTAAPPLPASSSAGGSEGGGAGDDSAVEGGEDTEDFGEFVAA